MKNSEKMYHIGLTEEDIEGAKYAIITGDPLRVLKIAERMDSYKELQVSREYTSCLGLIDNQNVLVISTGMGSPATAICVEELHQIGIEYIIRVGTCGAMQLNINSGDLVIAQGSIRQEGTTKEYIPLEFPAIANIDVTNALISSSKELNCTYHLGIVQCKDSFYGQHCPQRMPVGYELENKFNAWIKGGCLASEMETSALFIVSQILGIKSGAILLAVWNQEQEKNGINKEACFDMNKAIQVAIKAIKKIINTNN